MNNVIDSSIKRGKKSGFSCHLLDWVRACFLCVICLVSGILFPQIVTANEFDEAMQLLQSKSFDDVGLGIDKLVQSGDERSTSILTLLSEGKIFKHKKEKKLVVVDEKRGSMYIIHDLFNPEAKEEIKKRRLKRVSMNNKLREKITRLLAIINLTHQDKHIRLASAENLLGTNDPHTLEMLQTLIEQESNTRVRGAMQDTLAISTLNSDDPQQQMTAVKHLSMSLYPQARSSLNNVAESALVDKEVQLAAQQAINKIDSKVKLYSLAENLFFGISLGSVLVLAAIGLAITFGVMGVINMAHGELIMLGAYTTYGLQVAFELWFPELKWAAIIIAVPIAFVVSGLVGILIERGVIQFLKGRPLETLLATFGVSLILQQVVRVFISPNNVPVENPEWMSGSIALNPALSLTMNRLCIVGFCFFVFAVLFFILRYTRLGLQVRAVSQNRSMARAMGVRSEWVDALTFGLGSGVAGVAGVALSQLTNVGPNLGQQYIIDSFMVVVFGGVGNLWGTLVAGLSLGIANKAIEPLAGAVLAKILVLVFIILFIQKRPRGLFPQKGRAVED